MTPTLGTIYPMGRGSDYCVSLVFVTCRSTKKNMPEFKGKLSSWPRQQRNFFLCLAIQK